MGFLLLVPFFLIRFGLLAFLDKGAVARAAHFAPLLKKEKPAYWIYQIANAAIFLDLFFLKIKFTPATLFYAGAAVYAAGTLLLAVSMVNFAAPSESGVNQNGLYRLSRNPMYVAYFIFFVGCLLLTQSLLLLGFTIVFQVSSHSIIRSEERWCLAHFGEAYRQYIKKVRRYL
ncbi:methyltransferase [Eubacterium sp. 1001713B170207_170306_E7]|uniref:methyltransferase family protein n=1 Tax=Eubacterium sp. 1001713B170207_170306_E7 TaxID=2787097 RepID=UPI0018971ED0|nr:methyltransferase [Eubacterium sp. 1001713B170207_170306_E7]